MQKASDQPSIKEAHELNVLGREYEVLGFDLLSTSTTSIF